METVFAWLLMSSIILADYPWSAWLLSRSPRQDGLWLTALVTLALSIGTLTLVMFWEAVAGIPFSLWGITLPYSALMLPGIGLWYCDRRKMRSVPTRSPTDDSRASVARRYVGLLLLLISASILFNAAYWPFHRDDTLGIYHRYGKLMYETDTLVPFAGRDDAFYQAYPIQIPLAYSYAYIASGWVNEYLANTIATLLGLACLPAAFVLGRMLYGHWGGWLSALLLAFAPTFARWASAGYVDLPMAFLYTLAAIFAWRMWENGHWVDALLAGVAIGLAAWTKNAALFGVGLLFLSLLYTWRQGRIPFRHILLTLAVCAAVAAPWYTRNWLEARLIVPPTAWTDQAERSLRTLFLLITQPQDFALTGWVILIAVLTTAIEGVRRPPGQPVHLLLVIWTIPFFIVWWLLVSYDPRFVLLFLPLLCVWGGGWMVRAWGWLPVGWQKRFVLPLAAVALVWACYIAWISIEYKGDILRNPLMSNVDKHEIVLNNR